MNMQLSDFDIDCSIYDRSAELQPRYASLKFLCRYCRGESIESDINFSEFKTANHHIGLLEETEQFFPGPHEFNDSESSNCEIRLFSEPTAWEDEMVSHNGPEVSSDADGFPEGQTQATVLLVEFRDEVFARIATDMAEIGLHVLRARSVTEALELCGTLSPDLVVVNVNQIDQSGWLLAAKLKFIDSAIRVWLYQPQSSPREVRMAKFLRVDELLNYQGNLFGLSDTLVQLLDEFWKSANPVTVEDLWLSGKPVAAGPS